MITFLLWKWANPAYRSRFNANAVNILRASIIRNYHLPCRVLTVTDDPRGVKGETFPLWNDYATLRNPSGKHLPSCYRRLKMFDPETLVAMGISLGSIVVSVDLDCVIMNPIDKLFQDDKNDFTGWLVPGMIMNHKFYNGSLIRFRAGTNSELWSEFDPIQSPALASTKGWAGSDQGWISYRKFGRPSVSSWTPDRDLIFNYQRDILRRRHSPFLARMIFFNGKNKPWDRALQDQHPWIAKHWRE